MSPFKICLFAIFTILFLWFVKVFLLKDFKSAQQIGYCTEHLIVGCRVTAIFPPDLVRNIIFKCISFKILLYIN